MQCAMVHLLWRSLPQKGMTHVWASYTLAKFVGKNIGDSNTQQPDCVLALPTLGDSTQIVPFIFVLHHRRWPRQVRSLSVVCCCRQCYCQLTLPMYTSLKHIAWLFVANFANVREPLHIACTID
jgi:hypothetical protein